MMSKKMESVILGSTIMFILLVLIVPQIIGWKESSDRDQAMAVVNEMQPCFAEILDDLNDENIYLWTEIKEFSSSIPVLNWYEENPSYSIVHVMRARDLIKRLELTSEKFRTKHAMSIGRLLYLSDKLPTHIGFGGYQ